MLIRPLCLLLCIGFVHINAYPAPQDAIEESNDPVTTDDPNSTSDESLPESTEVLGIDESNGENTESDGEESSADDNVPEESDGDNQEPSPTGSGEGEDSEANPEEPINDNDEPSTDQSGEDDSGDSGSGDEESNPEESTTDNPEDPGVDESLPNEPRDSEPKGGDGIPVIVLSNIFVGERQLRVAVNDNGYEKLFCQMVLGKTEEIIDKQCFTLRPINPFIFGRKQEFVILDQKIIEGQKYLCQAVLSPFQGLLQQLCITHDRWIFNPVQLHQNLILHK